MTATTTTTSSALSRETAGPNTFERIASLALMLTPAIFALTTFGSVSEFGMISRRLSVPVRIGELLIIAAAMREGFSISRTWTSLALATRWIAGLWIVCVVLGAAFATHDPAGARSLAIGTLIHGVLALAFLDRLRSRSADCSLALLRALGIGLAGYAVAASLCMIAVFDRPDFPFDFFSAGVTNLRQIGFFGIPAVGIALGMLAVAKSHAERNLQVFVLFAGLFLVIWCGGRASVLGAVAAFSVAVVFATGRRRMLAVATACCTAIAIPAAHLLSPSPIFGPVSLLRLVQPSGSADGYSSSRLSFWEWALEDIVARPFPGHGEGQFAFLIVEKVGHVYNHPHNFVLQAMYEWGVPGFLAIAALILLTLWQALKLRGAALAQALPALAGFVGLATTSLLDGALYYPMPIVCAVLFLVVIALRAQDVRPVGGDVAAPRDL